MYLEEDEHPFAPWSEMHLLLALLAFSLPPHPGLCRTPPGPGS